MELCLRARAAGIPTVLHPRLRVRHTGGHATLRDGEPFDAARAPPPRGDRAHARHRALAVDDLAQGLTFAGRTAAHALGSGDAKRPFKQLRALGRAVGAAPPPDSGTP